MLPKVGIILINYQDYAERFLAECRDALRALTYPKDRYAVYIVDNATTPASQAYLRQQYPEAVVIPEATNAGWGGGNTIGAACAFADGCTDVVFVNMDTIAHPQWLDEFVAAAASDSRIGVVQSKLLLHPIGADGVQRVNSLGNAYHILGFGFCDGYGTPDDGGADARIRDIAYASGASLYVRGAVLRAVGYCNPEYFMYHDDIELCLKVRLAGYRVVLAPRSVLWHKYEFSRSVRQVEYMERNRLRVLLTFYRIPTLLLLAPALFTMELVVLTGGILGGYARAKLRAWAYFVRPKAWRKLARERREIRALRTIPDRVLLRDASGRIEFQEVAHPLLTYAVNPLVAAYWWLARRLLWW